MAKPPKPKVGPRMTVRDAYLLTKQHLERIERLIMATSDEVMAAEDQLIQTVKDKATQVQTHIDALLAQISAGATPDQLSAIAQKIADANAGVLNIDQQVTARRAKHSK